MKIFVAGTRGIPNIPGGVERHCEELYPRLASKGLEVRISRRIPYVDQNMEKWNGVSLVDLNTPRKKSLEAIVHTTLSILEAKRWGADLVHIHAVGPGLVVPFARLLGLKVVFTNHGPDYERQKWGKAARIALRLGEYLGCKFANGIIVISKPIQEIVARRTGRSSYLIYNGVPLPSLSTDTNYLEELGVQPDRFLLAVARLVPEKGLHDLIEAFERLDDDYRLVIAGGADHEDKYSAELKARTAGNPNIVMPGYVQGRNLAQLFTHARLFVMPSYHEGLPIALLEALSYGLPVVVSDIPANKEVALDENSYFSTGNVAQLCDSIKSALATRTDERYRREMRNLVHNRYNWDLIADQTMDVYQETLNIVHRPSEPSP